ncbi:MAG: MarR family transcriptional regulator [Bacillota bacterium]|nr:MarR family transcriptional regulator [Bacillota bacterium]
MQLPDQAHTFVGPRFKYLTHAFTRKFTEIAREMGAEEPSMMHSHIMGYLYWRDQDDIFQRDIEETFNITRSSVTGLVKLMEKKGYISRQSVEGDARLKKLTLTPLGRASCERTIAAMNRVEALAIQGLSEEQLKTFLSICDIIQENLTDKKECIHAKNHCVPDQGI